MAGGMEQGSFTNSPRSQRAQMRIVFVRSGIIAAGFVFRKTKPDTDRVSTVHHLIHNLTIFRSLSWPPKFDILDRQSSGCPGWQASSWGIGAPGSKRQMNKAETSQNFKQPIMSPPGDERTAIRLSDSSFML